MNLKERENIIALAKEKCHLPDYVEENKIIYNIARFGTGFYHFISVVLALISIVFFSQLAGKNLSSDTWSFVSALLIFIVLAVGIILLEIGKKNASDSLFRHYHVAARLRPRYLTGLILLCLVSIGTSATGSYLVAEHFTDDSNKIQIDYNSEVGKIATAYKIKITDLEKKISEIENSSAYKKANWVWSQEEGHSINIPVLSGLGADLIENFQMKITALGNDLSKQKEDLKTKMLGQKNTNQNKSELYSAITAILIVILEALMIFGYSFIWKYLNRANELYNDHAVEEKEEPETFSISPSVSRDKKEAEPLPVEIPAAKKDAPQIGYRQKEKIETSFYGWFKRPELCQDLVLQLKNEADFTNQELADKHDCSTGTVRGYRRKLKTKVGAAV